MSRKGKLNWTEQEDLYLRENYKSCSIKELSEKLNRSISGVKNRLWGIGIDRSRTHKIVSGDKFNRLTAISYSHTGNGFRYWNFLCDCGRSSVTRSQAVISGRIISCGCYAIEQHKLLHRKPEGFAVKNELYRAYKAGAKKRNLQFLLNKEEFNSFLTLNCYYCNIEPLQMGRIERRPNLGNFRYNGIDRIDSNIGYVKENCRTCCKRCNASKSDMTIEEFNSWIKRLKENYYDKIKS